MKHFIILLLLLAAIPACEIEYNTEKLDELINEDIIDFKNYDFENNIEVNTIEEARLFTEQYLHFTSNNSKIELPEKVYKSKIANSKSHALFFQYLCEVKLGLKTKAIFVEYDFIGQGKTIIILVNNQYYSFLTTGLTEIYDIIKDENLKTFIECSFEELLTISFYIPYFFN